MIEKYAVDNSQIKATDDQLKTIEKLASELKKEVYIGPDVSAAFADTYIQELEAELDAKSKK